MAARTAAAADRTFRQGVQAALCTVSSSIVVVGPSTTPGLLSLRISDPPLRLGPNFRLDLWLRYGLTPADGRWHAGLVGYSYRLLDHDGRELLLLQWDPFGQSPVATPHLHLGRALDHPALPLPFRRRLGRLVKAHVPTDFVPLTALLRTAITDLDAPPVRPDWDRRLAEAHVALRSTLPRESTRRPAEVAAATLYT